MQSIRFQTPRALPARAPQRAGCIGAQTESRSTARVQAHPPATWANSAAAIAGGQRAAQGRGAPGTSGLSAPLRTHPFVTPGGWGDGWNAQAGRREQNRPVKSLAPQGPWVMENPSFGEGFGRRRDASDSSLPPSRCRTDPWPPPQQLMSTAAERNDEHAQSAQRCK